MRLARAVGIQVPETRLVHREQIEALPERVWTGTGDHAYAVRRFDRDPRRRPIHIEDLAQVRGFYPDGKYRGSFETIGALIYRQHDLEALREFTLRRFPQIKEEKICENLCNLWIEKGKQPPVGQACIKRSSPRGFP